MKKSILPLIFVFCLYLSQAQDMSYNQPWLSVMPGERSLAFGIPQRSVFSDVQGTPYANEEFLEGTLYRFGKAKFKGRFRYNAYTNEIENESKNGPLVLLRTDYYQVTIGNDLYIIASYLEKGAIRKSYFVEKNKGKVCLLKKESKELSQLEFPGSSYRPERAARFKDEVSYYLKVGSDPAVKVGLKKKDMVKVLADHQKEVQAFIKENSLKIRSEEDVLQLLAYYNSL
ncbi:hypothetical protein [Muriicola soli]|uniref:Uncharacterized protein n=1 Tax=Muriicola soli TaxID=2507538 RepID=A0A411EBL6_9FLAO|nr:hypothetical protein [Muriicola soli]QBA64923.1 hypothetical protein EQY75_10535 [Muriicola soli]